MNETKSKIIDAAEIEFAQHGFDGASVRDITNRAGVNIAAINYHFGSKETLFNEMIRRRIEPINRIRLEMLDAAEAESQTGTLDLLSVVDIIVRPLLEKMIGPDGDGLHFMKAMGRGLCEEKEFVKHLHTKILAEVIQRFSNAIQKALGNCDEIQSAYSLHFLSCAMVGAMTQHAKLEQLYEDLKDHFGQKETIDRLIVFITGGIQSLDAYEKNAAKKP